MSVKTYKTSFGKFSVVTDTDIYNNLNAADDAETLIPWMLVHGTLAVGSSSYKSEVYNAFASKLASVQLTQINATPETEIAYYSLQDDKRVRMSYSYYQTPPDIRYISAFDVSQDYVSASNGNMPYGVFTTQRSATLIPDYISFEVLVSNDDMTEFKAAVMNVDNDGVVNYGITQLTSSDVTISINDFLSEYFDGVTPIDESEDPYEEGGTSGTGGGTGTFDGTGDAISFPSLPTLSAVSTGFVTLYAPTITQLNALASYMWSGGFDIDTFRKLFADPMDVILGLSIVPVSVPISGSQDVKVGNISTGVSMNKASTQYVNVDCGTLQVKEYWGSCLDYAPNSKCQIYLPYIGTRSIDIDEIMGKTIQVKYAVDILSGALVANIMCGSSVLYSFTGACASSIPVVSRDFTSIISSAINIAGSIGMAVATGGLSTPVTAASAVQLGVAAGQTAMNVANSKPSVQHSGAAGGTSGMLGVQTPYLIFELPRQSLPQGYNTFGGYPANITLQLGSCTGFTKVEMIHLENIPATDAEINEIETLLKAGVIL